MMERIQQKIDGQEISTAPEEAAESKIVDLMEALQASVETNTKRQSRSKKGAKPAQRAGKRTAAKQAGKKAAAKKPGRSRKA